MSKIAQSFNQFVESPNLSIVLNTEGLYFLLKDLKFRRIVEESDLIFVDGIGLKLALEFSGMKNVKRLHGPDLFHDIIHRDDNQRQLILGGTPRAHELLLEKYPNLGNESYTKLNSEMVNVDELDSVYNMIEEFNPSRVFVCLGIRKQEYIGEKLRQKFPDISIVGVGASIDFESGNVVRSSTFMQKIGLEWLPRLIREPRMIPRFARSLYGLFYFSIKGIFRLHNYSVNLLKIVK